MTILLMAVARELLTTWEITKDKPLVDRHLAAVDKVYGVNAQARVRHYMREIAKNERHV